MLLFEISIGLERGFYMHVLKRISFFFLIVMVFIMLFSLTSVCKADILSSSQVTISETNEALNVVADPYDELSSLQKKYERLEEKLFVVITLFIVVIAALLCYIVFLLIKSNN